MDQMRLASERGVPPMRSAFFDSPGDGRRRTIDDRFMFGPGLLIPPKLCEGARSREVYLPAGGHGGKLGPRGPSRVGS